MLSRYTPLPTIGTHDLTASRAFYEHVLGFAPHRVENEGVVYTAGTGMFIVEPTASLAPQKMTFLVPHDDFDALVSALAAADVALDRYEFADRVSEGGTTTTANERGVWFKDPAGNVICVETH